MEGRNVVDEPELWACAHQVMRQHGNAATSHAAQRAEQLRGEGDAEGHQTWVRILERIKVLTDTTPEGRVN
ncbi:DUF6961 family protein [Sphingomonas sp. SRS2]|uniref:DUF6961 family protein n=1 Tax=Sphingomonas sp. SRS2 TaxID=133190 RepID=UPI003FA7417F